MDILKDTLARIKPVSKELLQQAQARLDNKTKPPGSLGRLEEFARRIVSANSIPKLDLLDLISSKISLTCFLREATGMTLITPSSGLTTSIMSSLCRSYPISDFFTPLSVVTSKTG